MRIIIQSFTFACLFLQMTFSLSAQTVSNWKDLGGLDFGRLAIDYRTTSHVIEVPANDADFKQFKILVSANPIHFYTIVITFDNNEVQVFPIDQEIKTATWTDLFVLEDKDRLVRKITLNYIVKPTKTTPFLDIKIKK